MSELLISFSNVHVSVLDNDKGKALKGIEEARRLLDLIEKELKEDEPAKLRVVSW